MSASRSVVLSGIMGLSLAACSTEQVYSSLKERNQVSCYRLPVAQQEQCLQDARSVDYEVYQRELKNISIHEPKSE